MAKLVMDGLNKVCWHDDGQVASLKIRKAYSEQPALIIRIWPAGLFS